METRDTSPSKCRHRNNTIRSFKHPSFELKIIIKVTKHYLGILRGRGKFTAKECLCQRGELLEAFFHLLLDPALYAAYLREVRHSCCSTGCGNVVTHNSDQKKSPISFALERPTAVSMARIMSTKEVCPKMFHFAIMLNSVQE